MKQLPVATHKTSIYAIWDLLKHDSKLGSKMEFNIRMYQCGSLRFLLFGMGGIGKNYWFDHNIIRYSIIYLIMLVLVVSLAIFFLYFSSSFLSSCSTF
ncbi:hypothetical protein LINPERPRIM_LOCUS39419, partial [Linum perenne]